MRRRRAMEEEEERRRREEAERNREPPKHGYIISLKSAHGNFLSAEKDMGQIVANRDKVKEWEYFIVEPLDHTGIPIRLRTWHGSYIIVNQDGSVSAQKPGTFSPGVEVWYLNRIDKKQNVNLKTGNGFLLKAEQGWGGSVVVSSNNNEDSTVWKMTKVKAVNFRSYFGKWLTAEKKKGEVIADRDEPREWETWTLERAPFGEGPGKAYYIRSYHGKYLCAELKKGKVEADKENPKEWETWWIEKKGGSGDVTLRSYHGKFLCAEKKKGHVIADRDDAKEWETWTMFPKDLTKGAAGGLDWYGK